MKIVINSAGYGMEDWGLRVPSDVCEILYKKDSGYRGPISDHIIEQTFNGKKYYHIEFNVLDEEIRTDPHLINVVEDYSPYMLKVVEIPDAATDWQVVKNNVSDREEVFYCLDGLLCVEY